MVTFRPFTLAGGREMLDTLAKVHPGARHEAFTRFCEENRVRLRFVEDLDYEVEENYNEKAVLIDVA